MAVSSWNDNGQKQFVQDPCKFIWNFGALYYSSGIA